MAYPVRPEKASECAGDWAFRLDGMPRLLPCPQAAHGSLRFKSCRRYHNIVKQVLGRLPFRGHRRVAPGLAAAASIWQWAIVARTNRYSTEAVERRMNHPSPASVGVPIMVHSVHE